MALLLILCAEGARPNQKARASARGGGALPELLFSRAAFLPGTDRLIGTRLLGDPMTGCQMLEGEVFLRRMEFIRSYCNQKGWSYEVTVQGILSDALRLAATADRQVVLHQTLFARRVLPTTRVPGWVDRIWLESTCRVLSGMSSALETRTSEAPSVAFEVGRHSAFLQSDALPKSGLTERSAQRWLGTGFCSSYRSCYGEDAAARLRVERLTRTSCRISMDHRELEKAGPLDCTTILGFLHGFMERLGARELVVTHDACCTDPAHRDERCVFTVTWGANLLGEELREEQPWQRPVW